MRSCTTVVTEIAYHTEETIKADVSFLTECEWREELRVLLQDLTDDDENLKHSTDLQGEAGIAWEKVLLTAVSCIFHIAAYSLCRFTLSTQMSYWSNLLICQLTKSFLVIVVSLPVYLHILNTSSCDRSCYFTQV